MIRDWTVKIVNDSDQTVEGPFLWAGPVGEALAFGQGILKRRRLAEPLDQSTYMVQVKLVQGEVGA